MATCSTLLSFVAGVGAWLSYGGLKCSWTRGSYCNTLYNVFTDICILSCTGTCGGVAARLHFFSPHLLRRASKAFAWVQVSKAKTIEWATKGDIEKKNCFLALLLLAMPAIRALALLVFSFINSIPDCACQLGLSAQGYPQADSPDHVDYQNYRCLHSASCPSP